MSPAKYPPAFTYRSPLDAFRNLTARSDWLTVRPVTATPLLEMLWESVVPRDALTKRFGFADGVSAVSWIGDVLWDTWGIAVDDCDRLVMSAGNLLAWITTDNRRLIAKWSVFPKLFQRLADAAALTSWLHERGIPVAPPIPARDGRLRVELDNVLLGVYPVIDGDLLDVGDPSQVTKAGQMLARLHDAMAAYPHDIGGAPSTRQAQLVHNDFRSANILHDGTGIAAVLDFEDVTYRTRVADLAKATVLLGTRPTATGGRRTRSSEKCSSPRICNQASLTSADERELQKRIASRSRKSSVETKRAACHRANGDLLDRPPPTPERVGRIGRRRRRSDHRSPRARKRAQPTPYWSRGDRRDWPIGASSMQRRYRPA